MRLIRRLLRAVAAEERERVERAAQDLRELDERVSTEAQRKAVAAESRPPVRRLLSEEVVPATTPDEPTTQRPAASDIETVAVPLTPADPAPSGGDVVTQAVPYGAHERSGLPSVAARATTSGEEQSAEAEGSGDVAPQSPEGGAESTHALAPEPAPEPSPMAPGEESAAQGADAATGPRPASETAGRTPAAQAPPDVDVDPGAGPDTRQSELHPEPHPERQPEPQPALHFEIEDAEPLDDEGVLDLHEGASEFVPVERRPRPPGSPQPD
jgi:hypothetical protein